MASPAALQIGGPCHVRCTPQALDGPFPAAMALGRCLGHAPLGTRGAPGSAPGPRPVARSGGAGPPGPCPLSCGSPRHGPWRRPLPPPLHTPAIAPATVPHEGGAEEGEGRRGGGAEDVGEGGGGLACRQGVLFSSAAPIGRSPFAALALDPFPP